jgi:hypothetical protein
MNAMNLKKRVRQNRKRAEKKRRRKNESPFVPVKGEPGVAVDGNGETFVSEERAETEFDIPRELLQLWSGHLPFVPKSKLDRRVRRYILVKYYCTLRKITFCCKLVPDATDRNERVVFLKTPFLDDLKKACNPKNKLLSKEGVSAAEKIDKAVFQVLSVINRLSEFDGDILKSMEADIQTTDPVTPRHITEEWDRYYGTKKGNQ